MAEVKLSEAQRRLLLLIVDRPNALREDDEFSPSWWIEAGPAVRSQVTEALYKKRLIGITKRLGGLPGTLCFSITDLGRRALQEAGHG